MKQRIAYIELQPTDGMWLTTTDTNGNRIFSERVYCPSEEEADKWEEWTAGQKQQWEAEHPLPAPGQDLMPTL